MSLFRAALKPVLRQQRILHLPAVARVQRPIKFSYVIPRAGFASSSGISKEDIQKRVLDVLTTFEKVNHAKLDPSASFAGDLGLDSLDAVEVVMAIEEEFSIEIPDAEADEIKTVQQAIDYIAKTPEAT